MNLTCHSCEHKWTYEGEATSQVDCPACGARTLLPGAPTEKYAETNIPELSPGDGVPRPTRIRDEQILQAGTMIGQYQVTGFLGRGGMGSVYKAEHSLLQRTVALKLLPEKFADDPEFIQRFEREARAMANLSHPGIVSIHDLGKQGDIYWFAMEYIDGVNLREVVSNHRLTPDQALKIVPQLCEAMEYAHSQGIIHRDIKPENIILDRKGNAKIADFGLAKIVKGESGLVPLTQTNVVMGTVEYMAPEQRDNLKQVDHRADIYSLGVVLYEMLTGELPVGKFDVPSQRVQVDVRVDEVVLKALANSPDRRYQRASEMGTDVRVAATKVETDGPLQVMDLRRNKALGECARRTLSVIAADGNVDVTGWDRSEIGVDSNNGVEFDADEDRPAIRAGGGTRISLFVPRNIQIDVSAQDGEIAAKSVHGSLTLTTQDGDIKVEDLDGRLTARSGDGEISLARVRSDDITVKTADGRIFVDKLRFAQGRANIESDDGEVEIYFDQENCSFRYTVNTSDGTIHTPDYTEGRTASGSVGESHGSLYARTKDGNITLAPSSGFVRISGEDIKQFWVRLPAKEKEKLGVFAIINIALFLFFGLVAHTITPALIVFVFWGMAIGLDYWKRFSRGQLRLHATPPKKKDAPPEPSSETEEPKESKPRVSVMAIICLGLMVLTVLGMIGAFVSTTVDDVFAHESNASYWNLLEFRIAMAATGFVALALGVFTLFFSMATAGHIRESGGLLRGGVIARIAFLIAVAAVCLTGMHTFDRLQRFEDHDGEVRRTATEYMRRLAHRDWEKVREMMTEDLQKKYSKEDLVRRSAGRIPLRPAYEAKHMSVMKFDEEQAVVRFGHYRYGNEIVLVKRGTTWQVTRDRRFRIGDRK